MAETGVLSAAVCFPDLASADRDWIESVRQDHDPKAAIMQAHLTIVYPQAVMVEGDFDTWIERLAPHFSSIALSLASVQAVYDSLTKQTHIFLMPDESRGGPDEIIDLHRRAYDGVLRKTLDRRVPYQPHITLGAFRCEKAAHAITDRLSCRTPDIACEINAITAVHIKGDAIRIGAAYPLSKDDLAGLGRDR